MKYEHAVLHNHIVKKAQEDEDNENNNDSNDSPLKHKWNNSAIAGTVIGAALLLLVILSIVFLACNERRYWFTIWPPLWKSQNKHNKIGIDISCSHDHVTNEGELSAFSSKIYKDYRKWQFFVRPCFRRNVYWRAKAWRSYSRQDFEAINRRSTELNITRTAIQVQNAKTWSNNQTASDIDTNIIRCFASDTGTKSELKWHPSLHEYGVVLDIIYVHSSLSPTPWMCAILLIYQVCISFGIQVNTQWDRGACLPGEYLKGPGATITEESKPAYRFCITPTSLWSLSISWGAVHVSGLEARTTLLPTWSRPWHLAVMRLKIQKTQYYTFGWWITTHTSCLSSSLFFFHCDSPSC